MRSVRFGLKRLAALFVALQPLVSPANPTVQSVRPELVRYGHAEEVSVKIDGWVEGTQVAVVPGGAYVASRVPLEHPGTGIVLNGETTWVSDVTGVTGVAAAGAGPKYRSERIAGAVATEGRYIYLAEGDVVTVLEIGSEGVPQRLGRLPLGAPVSALAVSGSRICTASDSHLSVADISRPAAPALVARYPLPAAATAVAVQGNRCYAVGPALGLIAVAVNGRRAQLLDRYYSNDATWDVTVAQGLIYLADGDTGLTIVEAGDDGRLRWRGSYNKLGRVVKVAAEDQRVLVADDRGTLTLFDTSRPDTPTLVAGYRLDEGVRALAYGQGTASVVSESALVRVDLSAESVPALSTIGVNLGGSRRSFIDGGILYVADWFSGLHLYDISKPHLPRLISSFHTPGSPKGVLVREDLAYVADDDHGLQVVDVSEPRRPRLVANLPLSGLAYTMKRVADTLYLASHRGGFHIIDIAEPTSPRRIGGFDTPGKSWALEIVGRYAFVADDNSGLLVFDVAEPARPRQVAVFDPGGQAEDIVIRDGKAFVTFFDQGLYILDVSEPLSPRQIAHLRTPGNARGVILRDNVAYVADWKSGLQIVDIDDLKRPRIIGHYDTKGAAWGVEFRGDYAYVLDWWGGLKVLDIAEVRRPRLVGRYHDRGTINGLAVQGNYAYAASGSAGLQVYDIKNALNPVWATGVDMNGQAGQVAVSGDYAFVAAGDAGVAVVDISNPFQARWVAGLETGIRADRIRLAGDTAYVAEARGSLAVISVADPLRPYKVGAYPGMINDLAVVDDGRLVLAAAEQGILLLSVKKPSHPVLKTRRSTMGEPRLVRVDGDAVYVYEQGQGIAVYTLEGDHVQAAGGLRLNEGVADMNVADDKLYLSVEHAGMMVIDAARPGDLRLEAIYTSTDRLGAIAVRGGGVFLGGETRMVSGQLLPVVNIVGDGATIAASVPAGMPMGSYDVLLKTSDGERTVHHNAFKVGFPPASKPKFTMDDLQKILKQKHFDGKAP